MSSCSPPCTDINKPYCASNVCDYCGKAPNQASADAACAAFPNANNCSGWTAPDGNGNGNTGKCVCGTLGAPCDTTSATPYCDNNTGTCVECLVNGDCYTNSDTCVDGKCVCGTTGGPCDPNGSNPICRNGVCGTKVGDGGKNFWWVWLLFVLFIICFGVAIFFYFKSPPKVLSVSSIGSDIATLTSESNPEFDIEFK